MRPIQTKHWSRADYDRLIDAGIFAPGERVELIDGEIIEMSPQKSPHAMAISLTADALRVPFAADHHVRVQMPLALDP